VSEWELRERREREKERETEAEELGTAGKWGVEGEIALFLPTPLSWHPQMRGRSLGTVSFALSFIFLCYSLGAPYIFLGQAWAEGKRGACNVPPPCGRWTGKTDKMYAAIV